MRDCTQKNAFQSKGRSFLYGTCTNGVQKDPADEGETAPVLSSGDDIATKTPSGRDHRVPEHIVIIDVDEEITTNGAELQSDDGTVRCSRSQSTRNIGDVRAAVESDDDDDDDCQIVEPPPRPRTNRQKKKVRKRFRKDSKCNASECEVAVGPENDIQKLWEEAALRKRVGKPAMSIGSRVGRQSCGTNYFADLPRSNGYESPTESVSTSTSWTRNAEPVDAAQSNGAGTTQNNSQEQVKQEPTTLVTENPEISVPSTVREEIETSFHLQGVKVSVEAFHHKDVKAVEPAAVERINLPVQPAAYVSDSDEGVPEVSVKTYDGKQPAEAVQPVAPLQVVQPVQPVQVVQPVQPVQVVLPVEFVQPVAFVSERERIKESAEFRKADEEEWALRQMELEKQAQEVQRLRKRRKLEADKKMEMETRQKQRVEEIREYQTQEKKTSGLKEQIRGQVQLELEGKVAGCVDLASLLRRLGIPVDGGQHCTPNHVNAAYKKALLKFHPDRTAASSSKDPRQQVVAEETFKLISRMKNTLQLVALPSSQSAYPYGRR